jgi:glyoxylase-like metal-dependent hydrolase (beta-lactamase superfamily II)
VEFEAMAAKNTPPNLHSIRGLMGCCHLLIEDDSALLIDTGLCGERFQISRILRRRGLGDSALVAVLLTHGHLDHTGNLAWAKRNGARVYAHLAEQQHINGKFNYTGVTKWCGRLEAVGRFITNYQPEEIDVAISEGDQLPFWGGLSVIHLPGHTEGHCGFYSAKHDLLFCGDMFASYFFNCHRPPTILNSAPDKLASSYQRILELNPKWILPGHYDFFDAELHRRRFSRLLA